MREEIIEKIMEIKYRNHNPAKDCNCETCKVCNELLFELEEEVSEEYPLGGMIEPYDIEREKELK